jgi:tetratricopeptide (TPR) repeat protein
MLRVKAILTLALVFPIPLISVTPSAAQESAVGRSIYERSANSVVLLLARDESGKDVALGSAFWIAPKMLITNAHVADAGKLFAQLGPVRLPCTIVGVDRENDLATLKVEAEVDATTLKLATKLPKPGDTVFVIGNPEGLEKAISQGIVAAIREIRGRTLIQITAPVSHGSSGGPVFDESGDVLGVTVGTLESGQNINFAIPSRYVSDLLANKHEHGKFDSSSAIELVRSSVEEFKQVEYSASPDSAYRRQLSALQGIVQRSITAAGNDAQAELTIAQITLWVDTDGSLAAARRACALQSSAACHIATAKALQLQAAFLNDDHDKSSLLVEGESQARLALTIGKAPAAESYYALADIQEDRGEVAQAEVNFKKAMSLNSSNVDTGDIDRALARVCYSQGKVPESEQWFRKLVSAGQAGPYDWHSEGARLSAQGKFKDAAEAYQNAARIGYAADSCEAAANYFMTDADDSTLASARACISADTGKTGTDNDVGWAHFYIAFVLNRRGVYTEALSHAKEATVLIPTAGGGFNQMAKALIGLQRYHEAVNSAQEAIRVSDGKYSSFHFTLGSAYFDMENWELARQSYEKAAELDQKDSASAYNVAVCFGKQGYYGDAATWYEEYLRRNPDASDKAEILSRIQVLKR